MRRDEALRIIRKEAKARGRAVTVDTRSGKGSHAKIYVGTRRTVVPKTLSPALLAAILRQLDLED